MCAQEKQKGCFTKKVSLSAQLGTFLDLKKKKNPADLGIYLWKTIFSNYTFFSAVNQL